jgi:hypothetical protein
MDIKKSIQEWFNGPQDYEKGLELLQVVSKKTKVVGKLLKGESKTRREKLAYELSKAIGLKRIPGPTIAKPGKNSKNTRPGNKTSKDQPGKKEKEGTRFNLIGKNETLDDYPIEIQKVVNEYSTLYMQRGKSHKKMVGLGDSNDAEIVLKRKELVEKIKGLSERMDLLYEVFTGYKEKGMILTNMLTPGKRRKGSGDELKTANKGSETVDELKKMKKNIQASISKDRNQLKFQNKKRPDNGKEDPMPEGPKRIRLEKRIKTKEAEIITLDTRIAKLE